MKITYVGSLFGNEGLCAMGRAIVLQLDKYGHTVKIEGNPVSGFWEKFYDSFEGKEDFFILNGHVTFIPEFVKQGHDKIIPICVFETTLPKEWVDVLNVPEVKEVWTISDFNKYLILASGVSKPVHVIYCGIDERYKMMEGINAFGKDKSFKFLNVSAPHAIGIKDRKGLDVLIPAFKLEFGDNPEVTLVLKINTIYAEAYNKQQGKKFELFPYLGQFIPKGMSAKNIMVIDEYMSTEQMNYLYNSIQCGVFPSRGEGFGMPQAECIYLGVPTITTNYSATNEFSDVRLRVGHVLKPLDYSVYPYNDSLFADPSIDDLRSNMRMVFANYETEKKYAIKHTKPNVDKFYAWAETGKLMNEALMRLSSGK